jgi:hypothetical protein
MKFILVILEYTLSSIVVFLFILKIEAYEVYALQCCIFCTLFWYASEDTVAWWWCSKYRYSNACWIEQCGCTLHFLLLELGVEVKTCIASHIIASLHMNYEGRYILLYALCSIYENIYYSIIYLQSCMFKLLLNQLWFK